MNTICIDNLIYHPATQKDLNVLRGIIYAIRNRYDGKIYIGKTRKTFNERYGRTGRWWIYTSNILLKRVLNYTSHEQFDVFILKYGLIDERALSEAEIFIGDATNAYAPYGYNVRGCGEQGVFHTAESKAKIAAAQKKRIKTYRVKQISTGNEIEVHNVKGWCQQNGIREMAFRNLLCGLVITSQGYCLPSTTSEQLRELRIKRGLSYVVKEIKSGDLISFCNIHLFCEEKGIKYTAFKEVLSGKSKFSCGYCLPTTPIPEQTIYQITSPNGEIIRFHKMREFERLHKIRLRGLKPGQRCRHGWTGLKKVLV